MPTQELAKKKIKIKRGHGFTVRASTGPLRALGSCLSGRLADPGGHPAVGTGPAVPSDSFPQRCRSEEPAGSSVSPAWQAPAAAPEPFDWRSPSARTSSAVEEMEIRR